MGRTAADQGIAEAQHSLGFVYETGQGVSQDYVEACKWFTLAAEQSSGEDCDTYVELRDDLAERMTPDHSETRS